MTTDRDLLEKFYRDSAKASRDAMVFGTGVVKTYTNGDSQHIPFKDYASKSWLRPTNSMLRNLLEFLWDCLIVGLIVVACAVAIGRNEARAAEFRVLLEPSSEPATINECQRERPDLGRPVGSISFQHRSNEPWFRRICIYA